MDQDHIHASETDPLHIFDLKYKQIRLTHSHKILNNHSITQIKTYHVTFSRAPYTAMLEAGIFGMRFVSTTPHVAFLPPEAFLDHLQLLEDLKEERLKTF